MPGTIVGVKIVDSPYLMYILSLGKITSVGVVKTVTLQEMEIPFSVITFIFVVPFFIAVIIPFSVTVAILESSEVYVSLLLIFVFGVLFIFSSVMSLLVANIFYKEK